jgi:GxxExxY protein
MESLRYEKLIAPVVAAAMEVHRELGPGLTEAVYQECLCHELVARAMMFRRHVPLPIRYRKAKIDCGLEMDLVVEDQVVVIVKAVDRVLPVHEAFLATCLKMSEHPIGLLINFNVAALKDGIVRQVK